MIPHLNKFRKVISPKFGKRGKHDNYKSKLLLNLVLTIALNKEKMKRKVS